MRKLLIAVDSKTIADILEHHLKDDFEIHTCFRGDDALQLLETLQPDVLVINLSLSHITGLSVLQQASYRPPAVMALTYYVSDWVIHEAEAAGVGDLIRLPCDIPYLLSQVKQLT